MTETYDFIVVGAGSAGAVMAERLSADGRHRVLLLEDGPDDRHPMVTVPKGFARLLQNPRYAARHPTQHRRGDGTSEIWLRGRLLGGSSAVNGMVWIRAQREDYDRLAELGNRGWAWADVAPYFRRLEDHALGASEERGAGGPIKVGPLRDRTRLADAVIAAGNALGLPERHDLNGPEQRGIGYHNYNIDPRGRRVSAARGFLHPARRRANLRIVTGMRVDRVLFEGRRAIGVAGHGTSGAAEYRAAREVVLCAGALGSPRILQLSGIGPAERLRELGIAVVHDAPAVGANMREHFLLTLQYRLRHWQDSLNREFGGLRLVANALRYAATGRGPLSWGSHEVGGFAALQDPGGRPDVQLMYSAYSRSADLSRGVRFEDEPGMHVFGYVLRPDSRGSLRLRTPDPSAALDIVPNYLATEHDRVLSVALTRYMRRWIAQPALAAFVAGETAETAAATGDADILDLFLRHGRPGYHACGTCAMGQGADAVVDERVRVRGVDGLRVMDCSIYPEMLSGNTNAPTMALAWRASDLILEDHR